MAAWHRESVEYWDISIDVWLNDSRVYPPIDYSIDFHFYAANLEKAYLSGLKVWHSCNIVHKQCRVHQ